MQFKIEIILDRLPERGIYRIKRRKAVRAVIRRGEEILLVSTNRGDYKFPGGGMEDGESEEEALLREIREETGYTEAEIGPCIGTAFEQNLEEENAPEKTFFQMESRYYVCNLKSEKRVAEQLDDYEQELGFKAEFLSLEKACAAQETLLEKGMAAEIPWLRRETQVLHKLKEENQ